MKRLRAHRGGYTIVETLIYLAVTGALFVSAAVLISGQQAKTEFTQTIREIESFITDVNNDISTGYYPSTGDIACQHGPVVTPSADEGIGTQGSCLFLGRLLHVAPNVPSDSEQTINIYTIIGNRKTGISPTAPDATTLAASNAAIFPSQLLETRTFPSSVSFRGVTYSAGGGGQTGAFGVVSSLSILGGLSSGARTTSGIVVTGTDVGADPSSLKTAFDDASRRNESPGVLSLCVESNAHDAHAIITINDLSNTGGLNTVISGGDCP
jgi:type II secretory pathway pseudopilin PulG